jgi:hypothetical protein
MQWRRGDNSGNERLHCGPPAGAIIDGEYAVIDGPISRKIHVV